MELELMGIDGGNFKTKVATEKGVFDFNSAMLDNYDISTVTQRYGEDDMKWKYDQLEGIAGTVATYEGNWGENRQYGDTKNHLYGQLRILLAIHQFAKKEDVSIVIGQPFTKHQQEKEEMILALQKEHPPLTVNGVTKIINIHKVNVTIEGAAAFYSTAIKDPLVRIIDIGSGTVNCITFKNGIMVKDQSTTLPFGTETKAENQETKLKNLVTGIHREMSKLWGNHDKVYVCGGIAEAAFPSLRNLYPNLSILRPSVTVKKGAELISPEFANAVGMLRIARTIYEEKH